MSAQPDVWRVSTIEGIFETDLDTLRQWIVEGCVLPTDKVSKGTLNWIDAGRVPKLKKAFDGELETPAPPPAVDTTSTTTSSHTPPSADQQPVFESQTSHAGSTHEFASTAASANVCHNHPDKPPTYICRMCAVALCNECPRFIGTSKIPVCPLCGDLCRSYSEVINKTARAQFQGSGFGFSDFGRAIKYPFEHKAALIGGALVYALLLLGGFWGNLIGYMIMFGCISHVISQIAWGRLERSFMPDLSAFSLWEDLVQPLFLGIGIIIVSWGPVIALVIALVLGVVNSGAVSPMNPAGQLATANEQEISENDLDVLMDPNADPKKLEAANKKLDQLRPGTQIALEAERSKNEQSDPTAMMRQLLPYLGAGIFLLVLLLLGIAWGVFYYPMALTVAGYTQSFWSVVNPLVGLDTIKRMRSTYFKAFGLVLLIQFVVLIASGVVAFITSPFALPLMGNIPASFINGGITFYSNLVIACLLGLSLYKCADRLGISVD